MVIDEAYDDLLPLSGIQHMAFCERQWALINVEKQWVENALTVDGSHVHNKVDNPFAHEMRNNIKIERSVPLVSYKLGLVGVADVVCYEKSVDATKDNFTIIKGKEGTWRVIPIEYKRGKSKSFDADRIQLCAQGISLEEMFNTTILYGYLYYHSEHRREMVNLDNHLRERVYELSKKMHNMFSNQIVPEAIKKRHCSNCSLSEICQPGWKKLNESIKDYLNKNLGYDGWEDI